MAQELKVHSGRGRQGGAGGQLQRGRATPVLTPFDEIERIFDELLPSSMLRMGRSPLMRGMLESQVRMPKVDLVERDADIVLRAEVPGLSKDELDISVDENSVTIRGMTSHEERQEEGDYYRQEITRGEFARSIALPSAVDTEKVKASLKDGVLELVMPKLEGAKRRKIEIQ